MIDWPAVRDAVVELVEPELRKNAQKRAKHYGPQPPASLDRFLILLDDVAARLAVAGDDTLTAQVSVLVFGLSDMDLAPLPPSEVDELLPGLVAYAAGHTGQGRERTQALAEAVIALGAGHGRPLTGPNDRWPGRWEAAVFGVVALFAHHVAEALKLWEQRGDDIACLGLRTTSGPGRDDSPADSIASYLAMRCMRGRCECGRRDDACLRPKEHHLAGWDPSACSFGLFVRQAVRGTNKKLQLGYFGQGMLARPLDDEYDVTVVEVATWTCSTCTDSNEVGYCTADARRMHADHDDDRRPRRRLVVTTGTSCQYELRLFGSCTECGRLFAPSATCPVHPTAPVRLRRVFVRIRNRRDWEIE